MTHHRNTILMIIAAIFSVVLMYVLIKYDIALEDFKNRKIEINRYKIEIITKDK